MLQPVPLPAAVVSCSYLGATLGADLLLGGCLGGCLCGLCLCTHDQPGCALGLGCGGRNNRVCDQCVRPACDAQAAGACTRRNIYSFAAGWSTCHAAGR